MFLIKLSKILDLKPFLAYAAALNLLETSKKKKKKDFLEISRGITWECQPLIA